VGWKASSLFVDGETVIRSASELPVSSRCWINIWPADRSMALQIRLTPAGSVLQPTYATFSLPVEAPSTLGWSSGSREFEFADRWRAAIWRRSHRWVGTDWRANEFCAMVDEFRLKHVDDFMDLCHSMTCRPILSHGKV
jgi:hypothetical protein